MEPLLLDVPTDLSTGRLRLRVPRSGDGAIVTPTVRASLPELMPWMPWATDDYDVVAGETWCRRAAGEFLLRRQVQYLMFDGGGGHVGNVGLFDFRWDVPQAEVGYWLGTAFVGRGYMAEAVTAVVAMARQAMSISRVVLRTDGANGRRRATAQRCGFALEGTFRRCCRTRDGELRDEHVYAKVD